MPASDNSRWWLAAEGTVAMSLVALPWSFGGAPSWTYQLLYLFGSLSFALWSVGAMRNHRRWNWHPVLLAPLLVLLLSLLQVVPLPPAMQSILSPPGGELRDFSLIPLGLTRWRALSMDVPSTARAIARIVGLLGLMMTTLQLGRREEVRHRLSAVVALSGVSIAVCGFVHLLANEESLFGVYKFYAAVRMTTPFGNTNHLAAYLALAASVGLALALDAKERDSTIGWLAAAFTCGVGVFLSYSRGGIMSFVTTWCVIAAAVLSRKGGGLRAILPWVAIGGTVVFAALLSFEELMARAHTVDTVEKLGATKIEHWPMLARGALEFWPLGMGVGAFELGFGRSQTALLSVTFTHPENLVLQWLSEIGAPLSAALFLLAGIMSWGLWKGVRETSFERYLFIAVAGTLLHDVFDFALELNAVAPTVAVVIGLLGAGDRRERASRLAVRKTGLILGSALATVGGIALVVGLPNHVEAERRLVETIKLRRPLPELRTLTLTSIDRHPADWVLYADMGAQVAATGDPLEALSWVNRVLFLRPSDARIHEAAAQALLRLKRPLQALDEFAAAWALGDITSLERGLFVATKLNAWDRVVPARHGLLTEAWQLLRRNGKNAEALALLESATSGPSSEEVAGEAGELRMRHEAELGDPTKALALLDALDHEARGRVENQLVRVHLLTRLGQVASALTLLDHLQVQRPSDFEVASELISALEQAHRPIAALDVVNRMKPFASGPIQRSLLAQREAELWATEGRWGHAIEALQTAARIEPTRAELHYRLGQLYEQMGSIHSALDEVRKGRTLDTPEGAKRQDPWVAKLERAQLPVP